MSNNSPSSNDSTEDQVMAQIQEVVGSLPEDLSEEQVLAIIESKLQVNAYSGPLPPPEYLVQYNNATPDASDRIIAMAEKNQQHRQECEKESMKSISEYESRGQIFGFIIASISLAGGLVLIFFEKEGLGTLFGVGGIASLILPLIQLPKRKEK